MNILRNVSDARLADQLNHELKQIYAMLDAAKTERDLLKAQVNCLRDALNKAKDKLSNENIYDNNIRFALQANPDQCLAEVKAKAIEEYKREQAEMKQMELATKIMISSI